MNTKQFLSQNLSLILDLLHTVFVMIFSEMCLSICDRELPNKIYFNNARLVTIDLIDLPPPLPRTTFDMVQTIISNRSNILATLRDQRVYLFE